MKRILISLLIGLFAISSFAQEHLKIKGVPIDGTLPSFIQKMKEAGCKQVENYSPEFGATLEADFAGMTGCKIIVLTNSEPVSRVAVMSRDYYSWSSIRDQFEDLVKSYSDKYQLENSYHYFRSPYEDGDGYEFQAIDLEKASFAAFFQSPEGNIMIRILANSSAKGYIVINYEDKVNLEKEKQATQKRINDDI